ncbi:MAG: hypothetical protein WDO15_00290 [Bacteroidota bacterium]
MKETIIYITGLPGFKSTVIDKLATVWMHGAKDIGQDIVSFSLPENSTLENLKSSIGADILSNHGIKFYDELPAGHHPYSQLKYIPGQVSKMSIWVNRDSHLTRNTSARDEDKS